MVMMLSINFFFFFNETAPTEIYTLSLHDALPICWYDAGDQGKYVVNGGISTWLLVNSFERAKRAGTASAQPGGKDRKSTRLNSSHMSISYAVFCLKKKKTYSKTQEY